MTTPIHFLCSIWIVVLETDDMITLQVHYHEKMSVLIYLNSVLIHLENNSSFNSLQKCWWPTSYGAKINTTWHKGTAISGHIISWNTWWKYWLSSPSTYPTNLSQKIGMWVIHLLSLSGKWRNIDDSIFLIYLKLSI